MPAVAPAGGPLTVAARRDLLGDAFNESVFMRPGQYLTRLLVFFDNRGVDGFVNGFAAFVGGTSSRFRRLQSGFVRSYALSMFGGVVLDLGHSPSGEGLSMSFSLVDRDRCGAACRRGGGRGASVRRRCGG